MKALWCESAVHCSAEHLARWTTSGHRDPQRAAVPFSRDSDISCLPLLAHCTPGAVALKLLPAAHSPSLPPTTFQPFCYQPWVRKLELISDLNCCSQLLSTRAHDVWYIWLLQLSEREGMSSVSLTITIIYPTSPFCL